MDNTERVTQERPQHKINGHLAEMALRPSSNVNQRGRPEAQLVTPAAVSRSSYLNEKDRHFRAAETVENGVDLAVRSANGLLRLDSRLRDAEAAGASPRVLAGIERLEEVLSQGTGMLVFDFVMNPYERW
jgi:hypothetical protein